MTDVFFNSSLDQIDLNQWIQSHLSVLLQLAREAGEKIMEIRQKGHLAIKSKTDDSPVTQADLAAHQLICDGLSGLNPQFLCVSEEDDRSHQDRLTASVFWLIDPLDGTKEFINGFDDFTVNIALMVRNEQGVIEPFFGVIYLPAQAVAYSGGAEFGAQHHHWQINRWKSTEIQSCPAQTPLRILTSRSHLSQSTMDFVETLATESIWVKAGSSSKLCLLAEGNADIYPRLSPICEWDIAAGHAILQGAGGDIYHDQTLQPIYYATRASLVIDQLFATGSAKRT